MMDCAQIVHMSDNFRALVGHTPKFVSFTFDEGNDSLVCTRRGGKAVVCVENRLVDMHFVARLVRDPIQSFALLDVHRVTHEKPEMDRMLLECFIRLRFYLWRGFSCDAEHYLAVRQLELSPAMRVVVKNLNGVLNKNVTFTIAGVSNTWRCALIPRYSLCSDEIPHQGSWFVVSEQCSLIVRAARNVDWIHTMPCNLTNLLSKDAPLETPAFHLQTLETTLVLQTNSHVPVNVLRLEDILVFVVSKPTKGEAGFQE